MAKKKKAPVGPDIGAFLDRLLPTDDAALSPLVKSGLASNELREASTQLHGANIVRAKDELIPTDANAIVTHQSTDAAKGLSGMNAEEQQRQQLRSSEANKLKLSAYSAVKQEVSDQFEQLNRTIKAKDEELDRLNTLLKQQNDELKELRSKLAAAQRGEPLEEPEVSAFQEPERERVFRKPKRR